MARRTFQASHPCPANGRSTGACRGYVVNHVVSLKRGGPDAPEMQWQTVAQAKSEGQNRIAAARSWAVKTLTASSPAFRLKRLMALS
jgi:hypothetical protein